MASNGDQVNTADTPKKYTKRSSAEYIRAMSSPGGSHDHEVSSPETPSPPRQGRRSSTSLGFFTSPLHPRAEAAKFRSGHAGSSDHGLLIPQSPNMRSRLLPPTTPKSRNAEIFLSPSPNLRSPGTYKDNGKPIREISNGLKARLNYALVKLQNGWVEKTLPELENELSTGGKRHKHEDDDEDDELSAARLELARETVLKGSSYNNEFLRDSEESMEERNDDAEEEDGASNSAHLAFLKALSSPKKKLKQEGIPRSPLQWSKPKRTVTTEKEKDQPSEVEAIETLMSLSSPQRSRSTNQDFSLPVPPKIPKSSTTSSSSSSSSSADDSHQKPPLELSKDTSSPVIVPIMQKQSSDSSTESLKESFHPKRKKELRYDRQHQTDVETDVEISDNDQG